MHAKTTVSTLVGIISGFRRLSGTALPRYKAANQRTWPQGLLDGFGGFVWLDDEWVAKFGW